MSVCTTIPRFDDAFKDEVRARFGHGLVDLINGDVPLRRTGKVYVACCPFHGEETASFKVQDGRRGWHFHCYGCGLNGDVFDWLTRRRGMPFHEAVLDIAGRVGMDLPGATPEQKAQEARLERLRKLVDQVSRILAEKLYRPQGEAALEYLRSRGISDEEINAFRLGYAPGDRAEWREMVGSLRHCGFSTAEMADSGVFRQDQNGNLSPYFVNRLIFTISDEQGRPVAFAGRRLAGDDSAKYINSPDTPLFSKGAVVYNAHRARRQVADTARDVRVVEGYTDVITMERHGLGPVVCCMGTAFTAQQAEGVWRLGRRLHGNSPIFCFDGDEAGQAAALKAARVLLPLADASKSARFAVLRDAHDPASLLDLADGVARMETVLAEARPMSEVLFDAEASTVGSLDTAEAVASLRHRLRGILRDIADKDLKQSYTIAFRNRLDRVEHPARYPEVPPAPGAVEEAALLAALLNHPDLVSQILPHVAEMRFSAPEMERARKSIVRALQESGIQVANVIGVMQQSEEYQRMILSGAVISACPFAAVDADWDAVLSGCLSVVRRMEVERVIGSVERLMPTLQGTPENEAAGMRILAVLETYRPRMQGMSGSRAPEPARAGR
jgi:DNA primase